MQPSSGGFFPSIQFFSTEAAAFVMPIYLLLVQQDATIQDVRVQHPTTDKLSTLNF
jgi:hypothetical protein